MKEATIRQTEIGQQVEGFIDHYGESLPQKLWDALEELAENVDNLTTELENKLSDTESRADELQNENDYLKEKYEGEE